MTLATALALIQRLDLNRILARVGRMTAPDADETLTLLARADAEDARNTPTAEIDPGV